MEEVSDTMISSTQLAQRVNSTLDADPNGGCCNGILVWAVQAYACIVAHVTFRSAIKWWPQLVNTLDGGIELWKEDGVPLINIFTNHKSTIIDEMIMLKSITLHVYIYIWILIELGVREVVTWWHQWWMRREGGAEKLTAEYGINIDNLISHFIFKILISSTLWSSFFR